ncbi:MAG TPA: type II toxin-antitoxin system mRNA interferase toxin, RelE/StbE family [Cytophagales bacterium]|nr:type II toxin-antitoxin system mRNA interferase toxin, RelE/StbE family [Cytophagales bacterium]HAA21588.1 type II toxin-antitoxin system mRNA interferase toxin, RelE/StbE family [Cytophagales bacterium]HAP58026.1 type II toxin-antitoxin system mRNA interferase toxin, RelE/StbE family [Cytophagales bacterium]
MIKLHWTNRAVDDLHALREYYGEAAPSYKERITDQIFEKLDQLLIYPRSGRMVPEFENPRCREFIIGRYRIIHELTTETQINILAIHSSAIPLGKM